MISEIGIFILHPEGMPESSRRLSEAIPPVYGLNSRTPKGCQIVTQTFLSVLNNTDKNVCATVLAPFQGAKYIESLTGGIASINLRLLSNIPLGCCNRNYLKPLLQHITKKQRNLKL